jgi:hypothetical protein
MPPITATSLPKYATLSLSAIDVIIMRTSRAVGISAVERQWRANPA